MLYQSQFVMCAKNLEEEANSKQVRKRRRK